ncbi:restriction endonuclease [Sporosarcina cyprini]|uniref:restriction endonuclease n=1 Tax=Sporosarcina cyprini TaxID=2910523 RepID=UPI001EDE1A65|nr:restriction endonuclease [Sporosarcina cyprini]MCG3088371.1 restriction endonuclease [Sporosarcina cyprini]
MHSEEKLYETLSLGIYHRFKNDHNLKPKKMVYRKPNPNKEENPFAFEIFVASIMENVLGGRAKVTPHSGDDGVDIFHTLPNRDVYVVEVKCYKPENLIERSQIAILHSSMVRYNATGGYFVTTSDYSSAAKKLAAEQGIKLIDGYELAQYWLKAKESWLDTKPRNWSDSVMNGLDWAYGKFAEYVQKGRVR